MSSKTEKMPSEPQRTSKIDGVIALLKNQQGATLEIVAATNWQPHSARAVLSGLKKRGHIIVRDKVNGTSRYRIVADAAA